MILSGQQRRKLQEAFIDAFPAKSSLEQMLSFQLSQNLDAIAGGDNLGSIVFNLIKRAEAEGWVEDLVRKAYEYNSGNPRLKAIAKELLSNYHLKTPTFPSGIVAIHLENLSQGSIPNLWKLGIVQREPELEEPKPEADPHPPYKPTPLQPSTLKTSYDQLRNLLGREAWQEADQETVRVILQVARRQKEGWLKAKDIENFSCSDLCMIDQLWVEASLGKFGFSVQRNIWLSVDGQLGKFDTAIFRNFGDVVGWRVNDDWLRHYKSFNFSLNAPKGHLPSLRFPCAEDGTNWLGTWQDSFKRFLTRMETCF